MAKDSKAIRAKRAEITMSFATTEEDLEKTIYAAWKDHVPQSYPDHKIEDIRIIVARPDAWICFKEMDYDSRRGGHIYYAKIRDSETKRPSYKLCFGKKSLIKLFRSLQEAPGLRFNEFGYYPSERPEEVTA